MRNISDGVHIHQRGLLERTQCNLRLAHGLQPLSDRHRTVDLHAQGQRVDKHAEHFVRVRHGVAASAAHDAEDDVRVAAGEIRDDETPRGLNAGVDRDTCATRDAAQRGRRRLIEQQRHIGENAIGDRIRGFHCRPMRDRVA